MINNIYLPYQDFFSLAVKQLPTMGYVLATLWAIQIINFILRYRLNIFGIYPRSLFGLIGIACSPFLHGNFNHLFLNSIPLFVLGMFILALDTNIFIIVTLWIMLIEGFTVWIIGRKSIHIGASGIISGYFGFILALAYYHPSIISLVLAFVALYYFGTIIAGVLPLDEKASWESHMSGLLAGIGLAYLLWTRPNLEIWLTQQVTNFF